MKEAIVAAALVLVAAGCVPQTHTSSGTTATTTSHAQAVRAWAELTNTHMEDMGIAVGKASQAIASQDYAGLAADCHQAHDAADALQGQMPTPDRELTDARKLASATSTPRHTSASPRSRTRMRTRPGTLGNS